MSMNKNLLIIGAGQHGQVAKETAETMNCFEKIDFLDDNSELSIGILSDYERLAKEYSFAFVAVGNSEFRMKWIQKLEEACYTLVVLIHSTAVVSPSAQIGKGSIIEAMAVVNTDSVISPGCIISIGAVIDHNSFIGDGCNIDCGAIVKSNSVVFARAKVESGTVYERVQKMSILEGNSFEVGM